MGLLSSINNVFISQQIKSNLRLLESGMRWRDFLKKPSA